MSTDIHHNLREKLIRARARLIWERMGCPEGKDVEFWLEAEKEIDYEHPRSYAEIAAKPVA